MADLLAAKSSKTTTRRVFVAALQWSHVTHKTLGRKPVCSSFFSFFLTATKFTVVFSPTNVVAVSSPAKFAAIFSPAKYAVTFSPANFTQRFVLNHAFFISFVYVRNSNNLKSKRFNMTKQNQNQITY